MYKTVVEYEDFDENQVREELYFRITRTELAKIYYTYPGGILEHIIRIINENDTGKLYELFEQVIDWSYGEKSDDGKHFIKTARDGHRLVDDFKQSEAYDVFMQRLITEDGAAAAFINGIMPGDVQENAKALEGQATTIEDLEKLAAEARKRPRPDGQQTAPKLAVVDANNS